MFEEHAADINHKEEGEPEHGDGGEDGAEDRRPFRIAVVDGSHITRIGGAVDADRSGSGLADCHDIGELGVAEPMVLLDDFIL